MFKPIEAEILNLRSDPGSLGIPTDEWRAALENATPDPLTRISHAEIHGNPTLRFHVASIPEWVNCHYHARGSEDYSVVSGAGVMLFGKVVIDAAGAPVVERWHKLFVMEGQSFTIPEGYAHQLCAVGTAPLNILFSCPDSHLDDQQDRTFVGDSPLLEVYKPLHRTADASPLTDEDALPQYSPRFHRQRWEPGVTSLDLFFDNFVPYQYEQGFAWRCNLIGKGEQARAKPFAEHPDAMQRTIAANAEVLLELFKETHPSELDMMRVLGRRLLSLNTLDPQGEFDGELVSLRDAMSRRHHEKWLTQYYADLESGKRTDANHRGAKPFEQLEPIEQEIMKVQTWGNWRILGGLSDTDYQIVRAISSAHLLAQGAS